VGQTDTGVVSVGAERRPGTKKSHILGRLTGWEGGLGKKEDRTLQKIVKLTDGQSQGGEKFEEKRYHGGELAWGRGVGSSEVKTTMVGGWG